MKRLLAVLGIALVLVAVGTLVGRSSGPADSPVAAPTPTVDPALATITRMQEGLKEHPKDYAGWAGLGVAYVQRARVTGDPAWYAKAQGAVDRSLALDTTRNYLGYAGLAALDNARHDFSAAEVAARKGLRINDYSSTLYGALADALTQRGRYQEAERAVDRMNQLLPGVPAFTRASYALELRGDVAGAREALDRAAQDAVAPADRAFVEYYLGELALHYGDGPAKALVHYQAALEASPDDAIVRAGRAKAEAALGMVDEALADYRSSVAARPEPQTVLELARLLESRGDPAAQEQYDLFRAQAALYTSSGVALDTELTLFEADHGSPAAALRAAVAGWRTRPFVEMADAYAWALHVNGRDREALGWTTKAFASGWHPAPALYHRGMIKLALGDRAGGRADLQEALRLDPSFDVLAAAKARAALKA